MRRKDGTKIGYTKIQRVEDATGSPWYVGSAISSRTDKYADDIFAYRRWLVHRHHLHNGLVEVARQNGVEIIIDSRVSNFLQQRDGKVSVSTEKGKTYTFDLVIGPSPLQRRSALPR
jgi:salicylate hydroxylase